MRKTFLPLGVSNGTYLNTFPLIPLAIVPTEKLCYLYIEFTNALLKKLKNIILKI